MDTKNRQKLYRLPLGDIRAAEWLAEQLCRNSVDFGSRMFIGRYTDLPVTDVPYIRLPSFLPPDSP